MVTSVHSYFSTLSEHIEEYGSTTQTCLQKLENDIKRLNLGVWWSDFLTLKILEKTSTLGVFSDQLITSSILSKPLENTFNEALTIWQGKHVVLKGEHAYAKAYQYLKTEPEDWSLFSFDVQRSSLHGTVLRESLLQLTMIRYVTHLLMTCEPTIDASVLSELFKNISMEQSPYISRAILGYPKGKALAILELQTSDYNPLYSGVFNDLKNWSLVEREAVWNAWVSNKENKESFIWEHLLGVQTNYSDDATDKMIEYQRQSALLLIPEHFDRLNIAYNVYGHYLFDTNNGHLCNSTLDSLSTNELVF